MSMRLRILILASLATVCAGQHAAAQTSVPDAVACADSQLSAGSYQRCALWMDGVKVRRGAEGLVIAKPGFFHSAHLDRVVSGDSAIAYATKHEKRSAQAMVFAGIAGGLIGAAYVRSGRNCGWMGTCSSSADWDATSLGLMAAGLTSLVISIPLQTSAARSGAKAIWWNNLRFAR